MRALRDVGASVSLTLRNRSENWANWYMETLSDFSALEIAAAPNITEAIPPTAHTLQLLIEKEPENPDFRFALGNLCLINQQWSQAISCFRETLCLTESAGVRCNLGVALLAEGDVAEAISELSQAILQDASLTVAHLHLGRAHLEAGAVDAAVTSFQRVLNAEPENARALSNLAVVCDQRGERQEAKEFYIRALQSNPEFLDGEIWLGAEYFFEGKKLYDEGRFPEACAVWGQGFREYPRAFSAGQHILAGMKQLMIDRSIARGVPRAMEAVSAKAENERSVVCYQFVLELLFSLGLIPELYERIEDLSASRSRWESAMQGEGIFPYVHYRKGVLHAYEGNFAEAYEELSFARDHLPSTKQRSLKVDQIITAVREISDELLDDTAVTSSTASVEDWSRHGFADPFSQEAWKQAGMHPRDAAEWRDSGFSAQQAVSWQQERLLAEQAAYWRDAGFEDPKVVRIWHRADFSAEEATCWNPLFRDRISLAIQSKQVGFEDPAEADKWLAVFMFPSEAAGWRELGFEAEEAKEWLDLGISDPFIAQQAIEVKTTDSEASEDEAPEPTEVSENQNEKQDEK